MTDRWIGKDHTLLRLGKRGFRLRFNLFDSKTMSRDADTSIFVDIALVGRTIRPEARWQQSSENDSAIVETGQF